MHRRLIKFGMFDYSCHSNERLFLRDFVSCSAGTSGGRLARWLQPDSFVDPSQCEALYSREEMRCGWPAIVTVLTRDQYGEVVHVSGLKVYISLLPMLLDQITMSSQCHFDDLCRSKSRRCRSTRQTSRSPIRVEKSAVSLNRTH